MRIAAAASIIVLVSLFAAPVRAQNADAEAQFDEGRKLMKHGDYAEACKHFDASEKLEPAVGTELNLGKCYEEVGRTASAWSAYKRALATAKRVHDHPRAVDAKQHVDALAPKLLHLEVDVSDNHRVPGLEITRNGKPFDEGLWNQSEPVDPDSYEIGASADGYAPWSKIIDVTAKDQHVRVPMLDKQPNAPEVVAPAHAEPVAQPVAPPPVETHWRKGPLALAIVGVVGLGAGITLAALSSSDESTATSQCNTGFDMNAAACPTASALAYNTRARTEAIVGDIGIGVGGAALAGALIWWLASGATTTERIAITPVLGGSIGVAAAGRF